MTDWAKNLWRRFFLFFVRSAEPVRRQLIPAIKDKRTKNQILGELDGSARWSFKTDILDKLETYFDDMRLLRKNYPDAYAVYSRVGANILPPNTGFRVVDMAEKRIATRARPSFGCVQFGWQPETANDEDYIPQRLIGFRKVHRKFINEPIQLCPGEIYEVIHVWRLFDLYLPYHFYISLTADGDVKTLKQKRGFKSPSRPGGFVYPDILTSICADNASANIKEKEDLTKQPRVCTDPNVLGIFIFSLAFEAYCNSSANVRVDVKHGNLHAAFGIDMLRTPSFFDDRVKVKNKNGRTRPIFHIVRVHPRIRDGLTRYVKTHFRGLRDFIWNDYEIHITMPGFHHPDLLDLTFASQDAPEGKPIPKEFYDSRQLGQVIRKELSK